MSNLHGLKRESHDYREMVTEVRRYRELVNQKLAELKVAKKDLARWQSDVDKTSALCQDAETAQVLVQSVAQEVQQRVHGVLAGVVADCLRGVFGDRYGFQIVWERKRGKTEAKLVIMKDGQKYDEPLHQVGGGIIDVASLALRAAAIVLRRPGVRRLLVLDEPLKNVRGREYRERTRKLLIGLCERLGFQILLSVDADSYPEFVLGKVIDMDDE